MPIASKARLLTLSQAGILALDHRTWSSGSIISAVPSGKGVEYTILFSMAPASISATSSESGGNRSLVGIPLSSSDSFALRFTLLSATAPQDPRLSARLSVGVIVNQQRYPTAYVPAQLRGAGSTVIASTGTDAAVTKTVGFTAYIAPAFSADWPPSGATVRLLVEPAENATRQVNPRPEVAEVGL